MICPTTIQNVGMEMPEEREWDKKGKWQSEF